jgi:hypothetical protein
MNSQSSVRLDAHELGKKPVTEKYTVTLDKYECQMVELVVDDWLKVDKARGVWNRTKDPLRLRQAMGAQMAFAKLFNCYMAWDRKYAFYDHFLTLWVEGQCVKKTVDVKYTGHQNGMLCADLETKERGVCDLYVLMFGLYPTFTFKGCIPGELFIREENVSGVFWKPVYAVDQKVLSMDFFF